jgi:hypothetical protein
VLYCNQFLLAVAADTQGVVQKNRLEWEFVAETRQYYGVVKNKAIGYAVSQW